MDLLIWGIVLLSVPVISIIMAIRSLSRDIDRQLKTETLTRPPSEGFREPGPVK